MSWVKKNCPRCALIRDVRLFDYIRSHILRMVQWAALNEPRKMCEKCNPCWNSARNLCMECVCERGNEPNGTRCWHLLCKRLFRLFANRFLELFLENALDKARRRTYIEDAPKVYSQLLVYLGHLTHMLLLINIISPIFVKLLT